MGSSAWAAVQLCWALQRLVQRTHLRRCLWGGQAEGRPRISLAAV